MHPLKFLLEMEKSEEVFPMVPGGLHKVLNAAGIRAGLPSQRRERVPLAARFVVIFDGRGRLSGVQGLQNLRVFE